MKRCFIYAAGTFYGLREPPRGGDLQIAADAGLHLCERLGVRPDVVLGDFDSMDVRQAPADCIRVPVEKDDTDTMLALREGLRRGSGSCSSRSRCRACRRSGRRTGSPCGPGAQGRFRRHRLDADLHAARDPDDHPWPGPVLRRPGPQQEHAVGADA